MAEKNASEKLKVFVSYSRADIDFADQLVDALELSGFEPIIDRHGISGGENWRSRLGGLIAEADTIVFVLSPDSAKSEICAWEVAEGDRLAKRLIPVICRSLGDTLAPPRLADLNYIFFYKEQNSPDSGFVSGRKRLVEALNIDLEWMREHTRYSERAMQWEKGDQAESRLLSGSDIGIAKTWLARRPNTAPDVLPLVLAFITSSEQVQQQRNNKEAQRLEAMEMAQTERAKALEKAETATKKQVKTAKSVVRRTMIGGAASLLFALAAGGAGYWAWLEKGKAQEAEAKERDAKVVAKTLKKRAEIETIKALNALTQAESERKRAEGLLRIGWKIEDTARKVFVQHAPAESSTVLIDYVEDGMNNVCSGVLVSKSAVLTAAHCSCGSEYKVILGADDVIELGVEDYKGKDTVIPATVLGRYHNFDCSVKNQPQHGNDIAVLKLARAAENDRGTKSKFNVARTVTPDIATSETLGLLKVAYGITNDTKIRRLTRFLPLLSRDCTESWAKLQGCLPNSELSLANPAIWGGQSSREL